MAIHLFLILRPGIEVFAHAHVTEILQQDKALRRILGEDMGRAQAICIEPLGSAKERLGIFVGRRRVHQHRIAR